MSHIKYNFDSYYEDRQKFFKLTKKSPHLTAAEVNIEMSEAHRHHKKQDKPPHLALKSSLPSPHCHQLEKCQKQSPIY